MPQELDPLTSLLQRQQDLVARLESLLCEEREELIRPDLLSTSRIAEHKQACLSELERCARAWEDAVRRESLGQHTLSSFSLFLDTLPAERRRRLRQAWDGLREALRRCQALNLANGRVISISSRNLERNLRLLKGQDLSSDLYNASGKASGLGAYQRSQFA